MPARRAADAIAALTALARRPSATGRSTAARSGRSASRSTPSFFIGAVLMLIVFADPASRHPRHGERAEIYRPARHHADADRRHRADLHRADQLGQLFAARAAGGRLRAGARHLEHRRLDAGASAACSSPPGRPTPSRRDLLHQRIQESGARHVQGHLLFGPALHGALHRWCRSPSRACSASTACGDPDRRRLGRRPKPWPTWSAAAGSIKDLVMLMILALMLSIMTAMAGSSRTLYQGSVDGWLPRYLSHVNRMARRRAPCGPTSSSTCSCSPSLLRTPTSYFFVLAVSNAATSSSTSSTSTPAGSIASTTATSRGRGGRRRSSSRLGAVLAFVNAMLHGRGRQGVEPEGAVGRHYAAALIIPVFWFRHYVQDGGKFPPRDARGSRPQTARISACARRASSLSDARRGGVAVVLIGEVARRIGY